MDSHRIVSLWDMLDRYAYLFAHALRSLSGLYTACSNACEVQSRPDVREIVKVASRTPIAAVREALVRQHVNKET